MSDKTKTKKEFEGVVVSNKMQNTVRVQVDTPVSHPVYKKIINKKKIFFAHTDKELEEGAQVKIRECKPYSKNVKWIVIED